MYNQADLKGGVMTTDILHEARLFLIESLKDQINSYETVHPWRKSWKYVVLHSLRVERAMMNILMHESHHLNDVEIQNLQLAAILHDVGKFVDRERHAIEGAKIAEHWLRKQIQSEERICRIADLIAAHSNKTGQEPDFSKAVLQDADVLDEIGALSIFMRGNRVDRESPFFFAMLQEDIAEFEIPYCEKIRQLLNTDAARIILQERKQFIESFVEPLGNELAENYEIEALLRTM